MQGKATWINPRARHWHLLDYVLVRRRDQRDMLGTKAIPGADGWSDHHFVISKMQLRLQPHRKPQEKRTPDLGTFKLSTISSRHFIQAKLKKVGTAYIFFCNEGSNKERCDAGVTSTITNDTVGRLACLLQDTDHRLMTLRLPPWVKINSPSSSALMPPNYQSRREEEKVLRRFAYTLDDCAECG
ncbi:hypothetical protein SprV_0401549100 [Sparganum proliferum]